MNFHWDEITLDKIFHGDVTGHGAGFSNELREMLSYEELLKRRFYLILKKLLISMQRGLLNIHFMMLLKELILPNSFELDKICV